MAKKEKSLKAALERHQGVDHKLERQKKFQKDAEKRKKKQQEVHASENSNGVSLNGDAAPAVQAPLKGKALRAEKQAADAAEADEEADGWESDNDDDEEDIEAADERIFGAAVGELSEESETDSGDEADDLPNGVPLDDDGETDEAEEDENDIPLSDIESIASEDKGDVIPHQRLTINNTAALTRALKSFALPSSLPFSELQSVTSATPLEIADAEDDLNRELAFYAQSLHAVKEARVKLKKEGVAFTRPTDYFAEMVKSEELMGKVKAKLVDEAARKKASGD
ncbi:rRNA-processing protein EBP2, partial [Oleoguttula sp. CCFEE 5521]